MPNNSSGSDKRSTPSKHTPFDYLLNAMENAASQECPADFDYAGKRQKVLTYVAELAATVESQKEVIARMTSALELIRNAANPKDPIDMQCLGTIADDALNGTGLYSRAALSQAREGK